MQDVKTFAVGDLVWVRGTQMFIGDVAVQVRIKSIYEDQSAAWCEFGKTSRPIDGEEGFAYDSRVFRTGEMSKGIPCSCFKYEFFDGRVKRFELRPLYSDIELLEKELGAIHKGE